MEKEVKISLTFEEVNIVLKALGNLPFNQVYEIIGKIHEQANQQIVGEKKTFGIDKKK